MFMIFSGHTSKGRIAELKGTHNLKRPICGVDVPYRKVTAAYGSVHSPHLEDVFTSSHLFIFKFKRKGK